jgi:hypothetical protein
VKKKNTRDHLKNKQHSSDSAFGSHVLFIFAHFYPCTMFRSREDGALFRSNLSSICSVQEFDGGLSEVTMYLSVPICNTVEVPTFELEYHSEVLPVETVKSSFCLNTFRRIFAFALWRQWTRSTWSFNVCCVQDKTIG